MPKQNLVHEAKVALLKRAARYYDPKNLDYDWDDAAKWERHALNAVLDLAEAERQKEMLLRVMRQIAEVANETDVRWEARLYQIKVWSQKAIEITEKES
jgi:hypothetical protein